MSKKRVHYSRGRVTCQGGGFPLGLPEKEKLMEANIAFRRITGEELKRFQDAVQPGMSIEGTGSFKTIHPKTPMLLVVESGVAVGSIQGCDDTRLLGPDEEFNAVYVAAGIMEASLEMEDETRMSYIYGDDAIHKVLVEVPSS